VVLALVACPRSETTSGASTPPTVEPTPAKSRANPRAESEPEPAPQPAAERGKLQGLTEAHNAVRADVGAPPLRWSRALARYAQNWADRLAAKGCELQHRRTDEYGENLFWSSHPVDAAAVVDEWASEGANYDPRRNACKGTCGHYTQVVWAASRSLGCGMATCGSAELWVCNYDPPGNVAGRKPF
jgi:uncharacterized protein YkwD